MDEKKQQIEELKKELEKCQKEVADLKVDNAVLKREICSVSELDEELFAKLQDSENAKTQELEELKSNISKMASELMQLVEPKN